MKLQAPVKLQFITKEKQNREVGNIICPLKNNCIFSKMKRKPSDRGNKEALIVIRITAEWMKQGLVLSKITRLDSCFETLFCWLLPYR